MQRLYWRDEHKQKIKNPSFQCHFNLFLQMLLSLVMLICSCKTLPFCNTWTWSHSPLPTKSSLPLHLHRPAGSFHRVSECPMTSQKHFKNQSFLDNSKAASQGSTDTKHVGPISEAHKILKQYQQHPTKQDWGTLPWPTGQLRSH